MARIVELRSQISGIIDQIYEDARVANQMRLIENNAALKIQAWFRGNKVRAYLKHLHKQATIVQKVFRGSIGRRIFRKFLEQRLKQMRLDFYCNKAVMIQKHWKGYYSRKYIFNYYKRKAYLIAVQQKNEVVLTELKEYKDYMERQREERNHIEKYRKLEDDAKRHHYLISTNQIPGVYNSPYKSAPTEMEYLLKNVKLDKAERHDMYVRAMKNNKFENISLPSCLPPLAVKPQGPFKDPLDVRKQRYRPFSPSLRVETDYESLEKARKNLKGYEWTERLHDQIFLPVDKSVYKKPYEPLMLTKSKFGTIDYGTKHFREELDVKYLPNGPFKSLGPPVPEFQKLNRTYVDAHFYMS